MAQLQPDEILDHAIDLLDSGEAALTMRALADRLDVTPAALYYWYPAKSDLLEAVAGRIASQIVAVAEDGKDWRATLRGLAQAVLSSARAHPMAFMWAFTNFAKKPPLAQIDEAMLDALIDGGFDERSAVLAKGTIWRFIVGHLGLARVTSHIDPQVAPEVDYPRIHQVADASEALEDTDFFEWGLTQLIEALDPDA